MILVTDWKEQPDWLTYSDWLILHNRKKYFYNKVRLSLNFLQLLDPVKEEKKRKRKYNRRRPDDEDLCQMAIELTWIGTNWIEQ